MGIITGYICLICVVLLLMKFVSKRLHLTKLNSKLMKIHKFVAGGFLVVGLIHFCIVLKVFFTRNMIVNISGIIAILAGIALTITCHVMKDKKREIHFHRAFSAIIGIMVIVHVVSYFVDFINYQTAIKSVKVEDVNLDNISDGEYIGEYDAGYIYAKVKVYINNHKIENVEIMKHMHERGIKAEAVTNTIVEKQKIDVDAVSGATYSSKVIKQACFNALKDK